MSQLNSSTSSSELSPRPATGAQWVRDVVVIGGFLIATLAAADLMINLLFALPTDLNVEPSRTRAYFDYGRSTEGKITRLIGSSDETAAKIAHAGWLSDRRDNEPNRPKAGSHVLLANYGMSFSSQVGEALSEADPQLTIRSFGGPGASPNCVYAYYLADRGRHAADVVMMTILSNRVAAMDSTNGMTSSFDGPVPFTFPRFIADDAGGLQTLEPTIHTLAELRATLAEPERRAAFIDELRRNDAYYASYLFDRTALDRSALVRIVRRAVAYRHIRLVEGHCYTPTGFVRDSGPVRALRIMVRKFAASVRGDGMVPIVLLVHTRGSSDHLYTNLADVLQSDDIPHVSTHDICPADDPTNYLGDGHFTSESNRKIARAVAALMAVRLKDRVKPESTQPTTAK